MKVPYRAGNPESGVLNFEITNNAILLEFADGKYRYVYNDESPGRAHVEAMKRLALQGSGLTTYVNQHVREHYARRLTITPASRSRSQAPWG